MVLIDTIRSREILDSRGQPTLETTVFLSDGTFACASVPSGASKSTHEALELRDKDFGRYDGLGVTHAVRNVNKVISPRLKKANPLEQEKVDKILLELDQTPNKGHLGANAMLSVSIAVAKAAAILTKKELYEHLNELFIKQKSQDRYEEEIHLPAEMTALSLPTPLFNLINGGQHAENNLNFQEYSIIPGGITSTPEQIRAAAEIDYQLRVILKNDGYQATLGDEGGFAPILKDDNDAFDLLTKAVKAAGYNLRKEIAFGLDIAANHFYKDGTYHLDLENFAGQADELIDFYQSFLSEYPILIFEDPFYEEDWSGWKKFRQTLKKGVRLAGDDLTSTNRRRVLKTIEEEAVNSVIIKPNQIGTLTETLDVAKLAKFSGFTLIASHRSGETNDTFIVDLAVALGAPFLKAGAPMRGERVAKYNRLMEIAEKLE